MIKNLDFTYMNNPYIQVIWEDNAENFTQERIKSVRSYFQKKYNTTNVNVITKALISDEVTHNVDISFNILDVNYQIELIKTYLKSKSSDGYFDKIIELNNVVDNNLVLNNVEVTPFKRWYIKNIEFSNFLSYGENQRIDFDNHNGITIIESDPSNFGGKSVLSVDLLLYLFFNETTKTSKAEEIFNRFTDKNKVLVKGEITIDGEEYVIVRNIERKKSRSGDWTVKTELDFFKKLPNGELQNFTGEQRRETENFIKSSIGTKEDFLMTILTTGSNLEELIDSKPTARGLVLSRFMGLDFLKRKEEEAKEIYSKFSKSMMSNVYNSEQLKNKIETNKETIVEILDKNKALEINLLDIKERILKGREYRDNLINSKYNIDKEIALLSPEKIKQEINSFILEKENIIKQISGINVIPPSSFYYEEDHDKIKEEINKLLRDKILVETKIEDIEKLKSSVKGGIKCEHCGIELINAAITNAKIAQLASLITQKEDILGLMHELSTKEKSFILLKKEFDEYEKNKLVKEKLDISVESINLKIDALKFKLEKYYEVQDKISENNRIDGLLLKAGMKIDGLDVEKSNIEKSIDKNDYQIKTLISENENNEKIINRILEETEKEKVYKLYLEIYGKNGISKVIMKTMMPLINSELQRLLEDSSHFRLEVRINEKNEVDFFMIDNNTQVEKLMSSGSGYERTIASLALRSVLTKICSLPKPNIIVMDEVFGKISNDNLDMVGEFFNKIKEYFEKIFIISHNPLITNWADNVIKVRKENNISTIKS